MTKRRRAMGLCACYLPLITRRDVDLRESPIHGRPGHDGHGDMRHAWCSLCAPTSAQAIAATMERRQLRAGAGAAPNGGDA